MVNVPALYRVIPGQVFSLLHIIHIGCVAHPASYPVGTLGCFPGGKAAGA
jgi:hypothetical protein